MSITREIPEKIVLDTLAEENGVAIAIVDRNGVELSVANDNSICRNLNPNGELVGECMTFCGKALDNAFKAGEAVSYTCHAGLECRAAEFVKDGIGVAAIVGRTFVKAENYRRATERAISGDWREFSPSEFFENILLTGSKDVLNKTVKQLESLAPKTSKTEMAAPKPVVEPSAETGTHSPKKSPQDISNLVEKFNRENRGREPLASPKSEAVKVPEPKTSEKQKPQPSDKRSAESSAWRSFFGSLLKTDYPKATNSILEFIAHHYGFKALVWLERAGDHFENTAVFGEMKRRKVRLGLAPEDRRLMEASQNDMPLELGERLREKAAGKQRSMHLFPIGVGGEISSAIAILDPLRSEKVKRQIARICHSIAPQMEILRLRGDVASRELLGGAVRRFSNSLKTIDAEDFWLNLTQNAAEMLQAERASLLVFDERLKALEIKAMLGSKTQIDTGEEVGDRVAKIVFARNQPVVITNVVKTGLPPAPAIRNYETPSFLSCPISIGGRTIGVMSFTDRACGKPFDKSSLDLFQAIAPQLAVAIDRATLKEKAGEFEQLSVTDALTGLLNRRYIEERLLEEIKRSNRHGFPMSFMMLDVDEFKSYNDRFGHPAGDEALKLVGNVIRDTLRGADVAARFGGEEFSILLPQTKVDEALAIAERIRSNVEHTDFPHRRVTLSIGVASCSAELCSSAELVSAADKALYQAKGKGRNLVQAFEEMTSDKTEQANG